MLEKTEKTINPDRGDSDLLWGAAAIARYAGCKPSQIYYLLPRGALEGAVRKLGHKTIVGSRRAIDALPGRK